MNYIGTWKFHSIGVMRDEGMVYLSGEEYLKELIVGSHISGQMKIAPEHVSDDVLKLIGKPSSSVLLEFKDLFEKV